MQKYYNPRLHNAVVAGTGMEHPRRPHVVLGSELNGYVQGDLVDANGICDLIHEKNVDTFAKLEALEASLKNESKARAEDMDNLSEQIDRTIAEKLSSTETVYGESVQRAAEDERLQSQINDLNAAIQEHQDVSGKADKTAVDAALATKADKSTTYTKEEVDERIDGVDVSEQLENYYTKDETDATLAGKQDTINDLSTIRSGAASGATAVQPAALTPIENDINAIEGKIPSAASTSNQLADKAFVNSALAAKQDTLTFDNAPTANSNNPVKSSGIKTALDAKQDTISDIATIRSNAAAGATAYQKPGTGIPKTDLASAVQTSLGKADTAIQSVAVGTTTTGAAGSSASVTNTGTATEPVLSFTIPQGAQGIQGIQGPQGERGPQGNTGVQIDSVASIIHSIDPTATYAAADVAGADAVQDVLSEVTELAGGLHKYIGLTANITFPSLLPVGYTVLDYIANTSSSGGYIDTGIKPNDINWKFEGSWMLTGAIEAYQSIIASYSEEAARSYRIVYNNTSTTRILINVYTKASAPTSSSVNGANEWNTFSINYHTATINGTVVTLGTTGGNALTNNMCLFSNTDATKFLVGKMRRFKAWHNDTLVRDMIPCINPQNVYGMYDIVNDVFYGSSNENNFTGGN